MELIAATAISSILMTVPGIRAQMGMGDISDVKMSMEEVIEANPGSDENMNNIPDWWEAFQTPQDTVNMKMADLNDDGISDFDQITPINAMISGRKFDPAVAEEILSQVVSMPEICDNQRDDNGNGLFDCDDQETCSNNPRCRGYVPASDVTSAEHDAAGEYVSSENADTASEAGYCADGLDNNANGFYDCSDVGCKGDPACSTFHFKQKDESIWPNKDTGSEADVYDGMNLWRYFIGPKPPTSQGTQDSSGGQQGEPSGSPDPWIRTFDGGRPDTTQTPDAINTVTNPVDRDGGIYGGNPSGSMNTGTCDKFPVTRIEYYLPCDSEMDAGHGSAEECEDGVDNDGADGIDRSDWDCTCSQMTVESGCVQKECWDGLDNDGDGVEDREDPDCAVWGVERGEE